jgi:hypothetical protein
MFVITISVCNGIFSVPLTKIVVPGKWKPDVSVTFPVLILFVHSLIAHRIKVKEKSKFFLKSSFFCFFLFFVGQT